MASGLPTESPPRTLAELTSIAARRWHDRPAITDPARSLTFAQLDDGAARLAAWFAATGVTPGSRVSLWTPNGCDWAIAYYGALRAGLVVNPLNVLLTPDEVAYAVTDCGACVLIAGPNQFDAAREVRARSKLDHLLVTGATGDAASLPDVLADCTPICPRQVEADAIAAVLYTSGTTGRPKGALLTHRGLLLNAALTAHMHARGSADTVVSALPLPHVYGAAVLNAGVIAGAHLVIHAKFDAGRVLADIAAYRATMFEGVPTMYHYLLAQELGHYELSSLTRCTVGGQTMPVATMQEVVRRLGCPLLELWGMTELGGLGTTHPSLAPGPLGSIGVALPQMELRIAALDANAPDPPRGEVGELCVRGPLVMRGYHGDPASTHEAIDSDGWLHTGDLARLDADGYAYVVDRRKDMILTSGYNVYPAEIERVIASHPAVAVSAVGAVPDPTKGEVPKAYVVLRAGAAASAEEIVAHCRTQLAAYKIPRQVQFVSDLPKTSTGKVLRRSLRLLDARTD